MNFKIDRLPDVHIVERYFEAVRPLQVKNDGLGLDYFIAPSDEIGASHLPDGFFNDYAVLVVGGAHQTKQIPVEKAVEIARSMLADGIKPDVVVKHTGLLLTQVNAMLM